LFCADSNGSHYLDGMLDAFRVWKGSGITAEQVSTLVNGGNGLTHAELPADLLTNLKASWDFDTSTGNLVDGTGVHTLTNTNGVAFPDLAA